MVWSEVRGVLAVAAVVVAIVVAFVMLDTDDEDEVTAGEADATTTTTTSTTTTLPPTPVDLLCARVDDLAFTLFTLDDPTPGAIETRLAEFYRDAADLELGEAVAEYEAAAEFYEDYVEVGAPFGFDPEAMYRDDLDIYLRYKQLVTRPALGVDDARANVAFLCQEDLPEPPSVPLDDLEDLEDRLEDELGD